MQAFQDLQQPEIFWIRIKMLKSSFSRQMIEWEVGLIRLMLMEIIMTLELLLLGKPKSMLSNWQIKLKINLFLNTKRVKKLWIWETKYRRTHLRFLTMSIFFLFSKCNGFFTKLTEWLKKFQFKILICA